MRWTVLTGLCAGLWLLPSSGQAFCGHYVGGALTNTESQMIVTREGRRTVLTMANDVEGDLADFGLVVPVPSTVTSADISVVDPDVLGALDIYTAPRLVSYSCEDIEWVPDGDGGWEGGSPGSSGCGGSTGVDMSAPDTASSTSGGHGRGGGLGIESLEDVLRVDRFTAGEYDLAVVSATDGSGLSGWLAEEGFTLSEEADVLLGEYLDAGLSFLVARVSLKELPEDRPWLSPLQIRYEADMVSIPIRLGTLSSAGVQDVLIYTIADSGLMGISSYPEVDVESECLLRADVGIGDFIRDEIDETLGHDESEDTKDTGTPDTDGLGAGYVLEYGWGQGKCDPCPPEGSLSDDTLEALGFTGGSSAAWVTRLHMRYRPEDIDADLVLYESNVQTTWQLRYVEHEAELEAYWPVCAEGWSDDPGSCPEPEYSSDYTDYDDPEDYSYEADEDDGGMLCASTVVINPLVLMLAAGWLRRRRDAKSADSA
ncbi:MAG: hypothetical protein ACI8RZ_002528 [Myxococcota bacterium]|jgi:hypothetical protein